MITYPQLCAANEMASMIMNSLKKNMNLLWHGNLISKRTKNHIIDMKQQKNIYQGSKLIFWDSGHE